MAFHSLSVSTSAPAIFLPEMKPELSYEGLSLVFANVSHLRLTVYFIQQSNRFFRQEPMVKPSSLVPGPHRDRRAAAQELHFHVDGHERGRLDIGQL